MEQAGEGLLNQKSLPRTPTENLFGIILAFIPTCRFPVLQKQEIQFLFAIAMRQTNR